MQLRSLNSRISEKDIVLGGLELSSRVLRVLQSETESETDMLPLA